MKGFIYACRKKIILTALIIGSIQLTGSINAAYGQLPDCGSGAVMYGVFNNVSTTVDSTEIRPIAFSDGTVGSLQGGRRYFIRKWNTSAASSYYGSSAMGLDPLTNRYYLFTQMSPALPKNIVSIDPLLPTDTGTVIGTTPARLNNYHVVKAAIAPNGYGYAIGVNRDSTQRADTCNVLMRFSTCGFSPTAGCATSSIIILGYLPSTGIMYKWLLYNGDIAFDYSGNLYFASSAIKYNTSLSVPQYTEARLFRINSADIPNTAGTGTIPMTLWGNFTGLDSTGVSGVAIDRTGSFYFSVRRYTNANHSVSGPFVPEVYKANVLGTTTQLTAFSSPNSSFSIGDLASCYFPTGVLSDIKLQLNGWYQSGGVQLKWHVNTNNSTRHYEVERSEDGDEFETIRRINATEATNTYSFKDPQNGFIRARYYRIKQVLENGNRLYSNVVKISFSNTVNLVEKPSPNPFTNRFDLKLQVKSPGVAKLYLKDQGGRIVYQRHYNAQPGENRITVDGLTALRPGIYVAELSVGEEVIREKLIKQ